MDFVEDLRLTDSGDGKELFCGMARFMMMLSKLGVRSGRPRGLASKNTHVRSAKETYTKGQELRLQWLFMQPEKKASAGHIQRSVSYLNFVEWVAPGGFCYLRSGWDIVKGTAEMDKWRWGSFNPDCRVCVAGEFRKDLSWWRRALNKCPAKATQTASRVEHRSCLPTQL